jgi:hypothetical protein
LRTPLSVFRKYFSFFSSFDWERSMLSVYGPLNTLNVSHRSTAPIDMDIEKLALLERAKH